MTFPPMTQRQAEILWVKALDHEFATVMVEDDHSELWEDRVIAAFLRHWADALDGTNDV